MRRSRRLEGALVGGNAVDDAGVVVAEHASDLAEAVLTLGVVADQPPKLMAGSGDGRTPTTAADFDASNTTTLTD
jgi:hypothetical protein